MVRLRSFRARVAMLSVALSGIVLLAFGVTAWTLIYRSNMDRVDGELRAEALHCLTSRHHPDHWFEAGIMGEEGIARSPSVVLLAKGVRGEVLFQSSAWPSELAADWFPSPVGGSRGDQALPEHPPWGHGPGPGGRPHRPGGRHGEGPPGLGGASPETRDRMRERHELLVELQELRMEAADGNPEGRHLAREREELMARLHELSDELGDLASGEGGSVPPPMQLSEARLSTLPGNGRTWRVVTTGNPDLTLVAAVSLDEFQAGMREVRNAFLVAFPAALWIIALGSWLVAQRALRPVKALTATAEGVTAEGLDQRIPQEGGDAEFARLITVFNQMMGRLDRSFQQAVRFSADAAHELKTPLTILQGELEHGIQRAAPGSEQQELMGHLLGEVQRLKTITRKLLLLSLADSGQLRLNSEQMDLGALVAGICEDVEVVAPGLTLAGSVEPDVCVAGDPDLLRQVVQNLVMNAVRYNRPGGSINVDVASNGTVAKLVVQNTGARIPAEKAARVFERFYRANESRVRTPESGSGLGLSLAREIARAHGGDVTLDKNEPDNVAFALTVPLA